MIDEIMGKPDVPTRELAIIDYLRMKDDSAPAGEIYQAVSGALGDTISRPAYYKLLKRLVTTGQIEQIKVDGRLHFQMTPQIHAGNPMTLDDVYELLPFVESTEAMARAYEAQRYFFEKRDTVLRQAAKALAGEPAADLFCRWIEDLVAMLRADLESYAAIEEEGPHRGHAILADDALDHRIDNQCRLLCANSFTATSAFLAA